MFVCASLWNIAKMFTNIYWGFYKVIAVLGFAIRVFNVPLSLDSLWWKFPNNNNTETSSSGLHILFALNTKMISAYITAFRNFSNFRKKITFKIVVLNDFCYNLALSAQPSVTPSAWKGIVYLSIDSSKHYDRMLGSILIQHCQLHSNKHCNISIMLCVYVLCVFEWVCVCACVFVWVCMCVCVCPRYK